MTNFFHWQEATECVKKLKSPSSLYLFVYHALMHSLDRSPGTRRQTGVLLHHLITNHVLSNCQCVEGLRLFLDLADDMKVDIPHVWQYLGDMIGFIMEEGGGFLRNLCRPLLNCRGVDKAGAVMSVVLHNAVHRLVSSLILNWPFIAW